MILNWIDRILEWNRKRQLRNAVRDIRGEVAQLGIDLDIVENTEIKENDIVLEGPDGARIIVSGLDGSSIKESMKGR